LATDNSDITIILEDTLADCVPGICDSLSLLLLIAGEGKAAFSS